MNTIANFQLKSFLMKKFGIGIILLVAALLNACQGIPFMLNNDDISLTSEDTPIPAQQNSADEYDYGNLIYVDSLDILMLESFPLQVHAVIKGNLPDGCTTIQRHEISRDGDSFIISIFTQRPKGAFCTEALVPYEYTVPLDVYGLPAGTYSVVAGEISTNFTFERDNFLNTSGGG